MPKKRIFKINTLSSTKNIRILMYVKCTWDANPTRRWKGKKELLSIHISSLLVPITCFCPEYRVYPISITQLLQTLLFHFTNGEIIVSLIRKIALKMSLSVWRSSHPEWRSHSMLHCFKEHHKPGLLIWLRWSLLQHVLLFPWEDFALASILLFFFQQWAPDTLTKVWK